MNIFVMTAFAEGTAAASAAGAAGLSTLIMPILLIALLYFMMIRPQRKKDKLTREMLSALVVGDKIITIGGIHGKIVSIKDDTLVIETGAANEKSTVKISRWSIREVTKPAEA